ncbi:hypothetical protein HC028_18955 [Planosporangium flavigriseum]|nr:hypothetical protein [Planosporangium flavigriseum]NJC66570.1 hypothetical protein [Planosporangium flavigriseum]
MSAERLAVDDLIAVARVDDGEALAVACLKVVEGNSGTGIRELIRSVLRSSAAMVGQRHASPSASLALGVPSTTGDESAMSPEGVPPVFRVAARALSATINGDFESADAHIEIAVRESRDLERAAVIALTASWFVQLEAMLAAESGTRIGTGQNES